MSTILLSKTDPTDESIQRLISPPSEDEAAVLRGVPRYRVITNLSQYRANIAGLEGMVSDGFFARRMEKALRSQPLDRNVQQANGLVVFGKVIPKTLGEVPLEFFHLVGNYQSPNLRVLNTCVAVETGFLVERQKGVELITKRMTHIDLEDMKGTEDLKIAEERILKDLPVLSYRTAEPYGIGALARFNREVSKEEIASAKADLERQRSQRIARLQRFLSELANYLS